MSLRSGARGAAQAAAILLLVTLAPPARADEEAAAAFKAHCGDCHGPRDIRHWERQRPDAAEREAWLDRFLRRHHPPPEAQRALILRHIRAASATAPR